jgi:hypothetical protein
VEGSGPAAASGQDEAAQGLQLLVHPIDLALEAGDLLRRHPQDHLARGEILAGGGKVGAEIEQFVLDAAEHRAMRLVADVEQRHADRAVGLVDIADRGGARMRLGDAGPVDQPRLAGVAGAGVDPVELDQISPRP